MGYEVGIYCHDLNENHSESITYFKRSQFKMSQHFLNFEIKTEFKRILKKFNPDFLFFAGGTINKPIIFYQLCIKNSIPFV